MKDVIINNIILPVDEDESSAIDTAAKVLKLPFSQIKKSYIYRRALDARHKALKFVYSVGFKVDEDDDFDLSSIDAVVLKKYEMPTVMGDIKLNARPVITGFGPAGIFAGLMLARLGYKPLILERGDRIDNRDRSLKNYFEKNTLDSESNVQFGEGGAGAYSDGKLTTRINDTRLRFILEEFAAHGAPEDILYLAKPHIGTDYLKAVITSIRKEIESLGGEVRFRSRLTDIEIKNRKLCGITINGHEHINTDVMIMATGHSSRDTYEMLFSHDIDIIPKAFSVGVRIEHLQKDIDSAMYGSFAGHPRLKAADYALSYKEANRGVYSFCMCPGGMVIAAASEADTVVTNGMSNYNRDGKNGNAAIVVSVDPSDYGNTPQKAIAFQRKIERNAFNLGKGMGAPVQLCGDYINSKISDSFKTIVPTYTGNTQFADLNEIFPSFINDMLKKGLYRFKNQAEFFNDKNAVLTGAETRTSAPLRIIRDMEYYAAKAEGLYPAGEGAGYAGGIMSAAADGIRIAEAIAAKYKP